MAIMAGEAVVEGSQRGMARSAAKRRRPRGEQMRSRRVTRRTPIEGEMGGTQTETETYGPRSSSRRGGGYASQYGRQARYVAQNASITPGRPTHQGAILAEFVLCIVIITLAPIATGGSGQGTSPSPYGANDLKRMVGVGVVYFLLALVPGEKGSRIAAWLGFLVMLILLMNAFSTGELTTVLGIFSAGGGTEPPGATQPTGP